MAAAPSTDAELFAAIEARFARMTTQSPIYNFLLTGAKITSVSKGVARARLVLTANHINSHGGLHGSVSATFVDAFGGLAITAFDGREKTGVSVDINVTYLGSAKVGEEVEIEGCVDRVGGSLGYTSVRISKIVDGEVKETLVLGRHTKFVRGTAGSVAAAN